MIFLWIVDLSMSPIELASEDVHFHEWKQRTQEAFEDLSTKLSKYGL